MRASRFLDSQPRWAAAHPFPVGLRLLLLSTRRLNGHQRRPPIGHLTGKWLTEAGDTVAALCPRARTNVTPERANTPLKPPEPRISPQPDLGNAQGKQQLQIQEAGGSGG